MIISPSRKFIFCHLHKTAGESITEALEPHLAWNDLVLGTTPLGVKINDPYLKRFGLDKHSAADRVRSVVGDDIWNSYYKFTFVRHPFHRVRSLYHYLEKNYERQGRGGIRARLARWRKDRTRAPWSWPAMQAYVEAASFSEFIRHTRFLSERAARSQVLLLKRHDTGEIDFNFVGRFENLENDFNAIAERIGLPQAKLVRRNESNSSTELRQRFSEIDRSYLADLYREDLDRFDYRVDVED
jgi:hypothetical protein